MRPTDPKSRLSRTLAAWLIAVEFLGILWFFGAGVCLGQSATPDHLEPISPFDPFGGQAVFSALIGKHRAEFWMMCMPTVRPEWAVILRSESDDPKADAHGDAKAAAKGKVKSEAKAHAKADADSEPDNLHFGPGSSQTGKPKWFLESAVASQPVATLRKNEKVDRKRMEIDDASADALRAAWSAVTRQTRYSEGNTGTSDGVTYQVYSNGQYGETWSPAAGLPAALIELGGRLVTCIGSAPEHREALLQEAVGMAKDIKSQADKAGAPTRAP